MLQTDDDSNCYTPSGEQEIEFGKKIERNKFNIFQTIFALIACIVPEWSTVRQTDERALLIEPSLVHDIFIDFSLEYYFILRPIPQFSIGPALVLVFLLGAADLANNNMR